MAIRSLALVAALASAGCMNVAYVSTTAAPHPMRPRPAAEVMVFQTDLPPRPFVEVGYLDVQAQTNDPEFLLDELREAAGKRGCDAIIFLGNTDATSARTPVAPQRAAAGTPKNKGYRAICIVDGDPT